MKYQFYITLIFSFLLIACKPENSLQPINGDTIESPILSSDVVKTFVSNADHRIWIGTAYGLNLYDGTSYTSFYCTGDSTSIPDNSILKLFRDSKDRIWVGTHHGLALYRGNGIFQRIRATKGSDNDIREIIELTDGRILAKSGTFGTPSDIQLVDEETMTLRQIHHSTGYQSICRGKQGGYWINNIHNIIEYNAQGKPIRSIPLTVQSNVCFTEECDGKMWTLNYNKLTGVDLNTGKVIYSKDFSPTALTYLATYDEHSIILKAHNEWIKIDTRSLQSTRDFDMGDKKTDIHLVTSIYRDEEKNTWVGYYNDGFDVITQKAKEIRKLNDNPLYLSTLNHRIATLASTHDVIWGGTDNDIFAYDTRQKMLKTYSQEQFFEENKRYRQTLRKIQVQDNRAILLTQGSLTTALINGTSITPKKTYTFDGYLGDCVLMGNEIYITSNKSFFKIDAKGQTHKLPFGDAILDNDTQLLPLGNGRLLIVMRGLNMRIYDNRTHQTTKLNVPVASIFGRVQPMSLALNGNQILIGTNGAGVMRLDLKQKRLIPYPETRGFHVLSMQVGTSNQVWMGTRSGLALLDIKNGKALIGEAKVNETEKFSIFTSNSLTRIGNVLYAGAANGCISIPTGIDKIVKQDHLHITGIYVNHGEVNNSVIRENTTDAITLNYDNNNINITFSDAIYGNSTQLTYSYKLEGYDEGWHNLSQKGSISYSSLPAGQYKFRLQAILAPRGKVVGQEEFILHIKPAPWASLPAWIVYIGLIIAIMMYLNRLYLRIRTNRLALENEKKQTRREKHTNEMNMSFFANISHEFRNPLTIIAGPLKALLDDPSLSKNVHHSIVMISQSVNNMLRLIDQMLDFNQLEMDALRLKVAEYDVMDFLHQSVAIFEESARYRHIRVSTEGITDNLFVWLDLDKLSKILHNLFTNALKHTPEGGDITLSVSLVQGSQIHRPVSLADNTHYLAIDIYNSGTPIAPDRLNDVFKRYYQLSDPKQSKSYGWGTGIGLYYVKRLVQLHHGDIWVESLNGEDGRVPGNIFHVLLPADQQAFADTQLVDAHDGALHIDIPQEKHEEDQQVEANMNLMNQAIHKPIILVVDDEIEIAQYIRSLFAEEYNVVNKYSAESALKELDAIKPDLILSDVMMEDMSGFTFCKKLKAELMYSHIPIILITGKSNIKEQVEGLECGANAYVVKPFDPRYLQALVQSQLKNTEQLRKMFNENTQTNTILSDSISTQDRQFMDSLYELMENHLDDTELNVKTIAKELLISPSKFNYKLKELTGQTPGNFFTLYKINRAAKLLREGNMNVSEVAMKTGFNTVSYFSSVFKKRFGVSPSEYRGG